MNTGSDLQGNINMHDMEGGMAPPVIHAQSPPMMQGAVPQQIQGQPPQRPGIPIEFRNLNTLDEPVCETIVSCIIVTGGF